MRCGNANTEIHKDVIIIGNGPSGIALSNMLAGNIPYVVSDMHPDEMLSTRLSTCLGESLVHQDLGYLADGLEGRTSNPISLLLDSLIHPCADIGLELEPMVEWRRDGIEIDHVVFGKGPPGGSWHSMDPHILTLSLGTWMALPGKKYTMRDGAEKRAFAHNVAKYYEDYVKEMNLSKYFENGTIVTNIRELYTDEPTDMLVDNTPEACGSKWVQKIHDDEPEKVKLCSRPEKEEPQSITKQGTCPIASALSFILSRAQRRTKTDRCCKRKHDSIKSDEAKALADVVLQSKDGCNKKTNSNCDNNRSVSFSSCDLDNYRNASDFLYRKSLNEQGGFINLLRSSCRFDSEKLRKVPKISSCSDAGVRDSKPKWLVNVYDTKTRRIVSYTCNYLILANGSSDLPNRLSVRNEKRDPSWLLHDVRSLEIELDLYRQYSTNVDPVLVVGAGLSAADAIIVSRGKNVPVIHVFRNKSADLGKQLPENMYPEYHKVHQMMKDGGSAYPLYTALPEYTLTDYSESTRMVTLTSKDGKEETYPVSFAVVLIGSRPDLSFLPDDFKIGVRKNSNIDSKTNPIAINKMDHSVSGYDRLYAIGPIAGDNFVRFLPGGALAIVSDLYKRYTY